MNTACVHTYPVYFQAVSGNFWKLFSRVEIFYPIRIRIHVRVDGRIRKFANTLTSFPWIQSSRRALWTKWHQGKVLASLLHVVALVSSLVSCFQINAAVINLHNQYIRDRQDVLRLQLSMNSVHHKVKKRANRHQRQFCLDETRKDKRMLGQFYQWHNDWRRMKREF